MEGPAGGDHFALRNVVKDDLPTGLFDKEERGVRVSTPTHGKLQARAGFFWRVRAEEVSRIDKWR